jgi:hypothetical protein
MLISVSGAVRDFQVDIVIQHRGRLARDWFDIVGTHDGMIEAFFNPAVEAVLVSVWLLPVFLTATDNQDGSPGRTFQSGSSSLPLVLTVIAPVSFWAVMPAARRDTR